MDSVGRKAASSNERGRGATDFENWAEQFRNSLKEKELGIEGSPVMEEKTTKNYNKLFLIIMLVAGLTFVTLSLLRML